MPHVSGHLINRTSQLTAPFQQAGIQQPGIQQPVVPAQVPAAQAQPNQPGAPQSDEGLQEYLTEQVGSIRRSMNTVRNKTFANSTRLRALNTFLADFGEILGETADPISFDTFIQNEKEITDTAKKIFGQVELLETGQINTKDFFSVIQESFNETEEQTPQFEVGNNRQIPNNQSRSQSILSGFQGTQQTPPQTPPIFGGRESLEFEPLEFLEAKETGQTTGQISLEREKARFLRASNLALEAFGAGTTVEQNNLALGILRQMRDKSISNVEKTQFDKSIKALETVGKLRQKTFTLRPEERAFEVVPGGQARQIAGVQPGETAESAEKLISALGGTTDVSIAAGRAIKTGVPVSQVENLISTFANIDAKKRRLDFDREKRKSQLAERVLTKQANKAKTDIELARLGTSINSTFQSNSDVRRFTSIDQATRSINQLSEQEPTEQNKAFIQQAMIVLFNKVTDPLSVVRESEYERTPQNISWVNRLEGAITKIYQGGAGITQDDLDALVFAVNVIRNEATKPYNSAVTRFGKLATLGGLEPELIGQQAQFLALPAKVQARTGLSAEDKAADAALGF